MRISFLNLSLTFCFKGIAQIPSTKETIQGFIDSIGRSNDRQVITSSIFPALANGTNFNWRLNLWRNNKKELLWVETIIPDSISTIFFYCHDTLIFAGERTYTVGTLNKRKSLFRNIFFYQNKIVDDSAPERSGNKVDYYIEESKKYIELAKKAE